MTALADPFTTTFGSRRGIPGRGAIIADLAETWASSYARFRADWDAVAASAHAQDPVPESEVAHSSLHAVHALAALNFTLEHDRGVGVRAADFEFEPVDEKVDDLVVLEMRLFGANVAGLVADIDPSGYERLSDLRWYISPDHMLLFSDDADGELTFITLLDGGGVKLDNAFTPIAAKLQTRNWLLDEPQRARARADAAAEATRRVHRRLGLQGVDLVCPIGESAFA